MKLSIVTPSYNQGRFIQETIDSVLNQNYPDLEYIIMDGGSTDFSVQILKTYGDKIKWVSEKDGGQADAVNKGILKATGDVIGWINSDDIYYEDSFKEVMKIFENNPNVNVVYGLADHIDINGNYIEDYYTEKWDYERLKEICYICQPSVFFRKKAVVDIGLLNANRHFAMDYDLWLRLGKHEKFYFLKKKLAGSRLYSDNKTLGQVYKVHIDIMDALYENIGYVPERWIEGSAHSIARSKGYEVDTEEKYHKYKYKVLGYVDEFVNRYKVNDNHDLLKYPYKYQPFTFGIDTSITLLENAAGVSNCVNYIAKGLTSVKTNVQYKMYPLFYTRYPINNIDKGLFVDKKNVKRLFEGVSPGYENILNAQFENENQSEIFRTLEYPDVILYDSFNFSKKLAKKTASLYLLYDLSFLEHPEYSTKENYHYCFEHVFNAAIYADYFVAISEYTKEIFLKFFPFVDENRIKVVYLGYKDHYDKDADLSKFNIDINSKFWLSVGTVEPRKNIKSLIKAYYNLKQKGETYPLYIAGGKGWLNSDIYKEVKELGLEKDIFFLGYVDDKELATLYKYAYCLIYPSWYEGFGFPILEAMSYGTPVICSDVTSMPEVGGDAVIYINPNDINSITDAMDKIQKDESLRNSLAKKCQNRACNIFSWDKCCEDVYKAMYEAMLHFQKNNIK